MATKWSISIGNFNATTKRSNSVGKMNTAIRNHVIEFCRVIQRSNHAIEFCRKNQHHNLHVGKCTIPSSSRNISDWEKQIGLGTIAIIIRLGENMVWARLLILSDWEKTWSGHDCWYYRTGRTRGLGTIADRSCAVFYCRRWTIYICKFCK